MITRTSSGFSPPSLDLIRFDQPGVKMAWVPDGEKKYPQSRKFIYDHTDSQIEIASAQTKLATTDLYGQIDCGKLRLTGLVHSYSGAEEWDFAAERGSGSTRFTLTENLDTEDPHEIGWKEEKHPPFRGGVQRRCLWDRLSWNPCE